MKGFMKSAARPSSKTEDEPAEQEQPAQPAAAPSKAEDAQTSSQPAKTAAPASSDAAEAGNEADNSEGQKETRGQMLQRHKRVRAYRVAADSLTCIALLLWVWS